MNSQLTKHPTLLRLFAGQSLQAQTRKGAAFDLRSSHQARKSAIAASTVLYFQGAGSPMSFPFVYFVVQ